MSKGNILITVTWLKSIPNGTELIKRIERYGYTVQVHEGDHKLKEAEVASLLPGVLGCIVGGDQVTRKALEKADRLSVISRIGAGFDNIDLDACTEKGIVVTNAFGAGAPAVAEFTIALILVLARRLCYADQSLREGLWIRTEIGGVSPQGKTLGIVGLGHIGKEVAKLAKGLNMKVIYYDPIHDSAFEESLDISFVPFDDLLAQSDFVTLHLFLDQSTKRLIGERELGLMKPTAYLVNTSRGAVVDEQALYRALRDKRIAGAAMDVFEKEPPDRDNPVFTLNDRVVVTPHMAGLSTESKMTMFELSTQNLLDVLAGRRPDSVLNPKVYKKRGK